MALALFIVSRKIKYNFQSFQIIVLIEHSLKSIRENPQATKRVTKWTMDLKPYGIKYQPRTIIKGQVLADFIAEFTPGAPAQSNLLEGWILSINIASNSKGSGTGVILMTPKEPIIRQSYTVGFPATNNEAEYEAVIVGL